MKKLFILVFSIILLNQFLSCTKDTSSTDQDNEKKLTYFTTNYGGCNGQTSFEKTSLRSYIKNDTVFYSIRDDTLHISIGHNYICCAPFEVLSIQEDNHLKIILNDTCRAPYESCYCRCNCYYEFEVIFLNYTAGVCYLSIYLHDPRQAADSLIHEQIIN